VIQIGLTSNRLKTLTVEKLALVKEIDKNPGDSSLKERLKALEHDLALERTSIISPPQMPPLINPQLSKGFKSKHPNDKTLLDYISK
jgi:hypothetical protein